MIVFNHCCRKFYLHQKNLKHAKQIGFTRLLDLLLTLQRPRKLTVISLYIYLHIYDTEVSMEAKATLFNKSEHSARRSEDKAIKLSAKTNNTGCHQ